MILLQSIIASSIQTLSIRRIESLSDYSSVTFALCSFSVLAEDIPKEWGYFSVFPADLTSTSYTLCSFSVPLEEIDADWGYFGASSNDNSTLNYNICSFSVPVEEFESVYQPGTVTIQPFKTSIYGLSSDAETVLGLTSTKRPSFVYWQVWSPSTNSYEILPVYQNSLYSWLSGGETWYDASAQTLSARVVVGSDGVIHKSLPISLKPYENLLDIPNLELWLDASDVSSLLTARKSFTLGGTPSVPSIYYPLVINGFPYHSVAFPAGASASYSYDASVSLITGDFCIEGWVYPTNVPSTGSAVSLWSKDGQHGVAFPQYSCYILNNRRVEASVGAGLGSNAAFTSTTALTLSTWNHLAFTRDGGIYTLYVNGVPEAAGAITFTMFERNQALSIGTSNGSYNLSKFRITKGISVYSGNFASDIPLLSSALFTPINNTTVLAFQEENTFENLADKVPSLSAWFNKSPKALTAIQTSLTLRPIVSSSAVNNLNAVVFDGTNDYFNLTSSIALSSNWTFFCVYTRETTGIVSQTLGFNNGTNTSTFLHWTNNYIHSGTKASTGTSLTTGTIVGGVRKDEALFLKQNPTPFATNWAGGNSSANVLGIYANAYYHKGAMCEIIHTKSMLPDEEIKLINKYLADKWAP